ncbi:hypothetical protein BASA81_010528 [Batrachochytrium salamandrivorans]|nr:hypothetical protein BASA81_010528 [Batrachochytrium salamandrivorans]
MWFPECKAAGTPGKPKEMWFRLVVTANNVIQKRGLPGQPTYGGSQQSAYAGSQQPRMQEVNSQRMFATVWVDDKVFSTTSQANNKFRMSKDQQGPGWDTDPYFFEGKWKAQTEDLCAKRNYKWSSFMPEMNRMTAPHTARAMWFPNCDSSASESSPVSCTLG